MRRDEQPLPGLVPGDVVGTGKLRRAQEFPRPARDAPHLAARVQVQVDLLAVVRDLDAVRHGPVGAFDLLHALAGLPLPDPARAPAEDRANHLPEGVLGARHHARHQEAPVGERHDVVELRVVGR